MACTFGRPALHGRVVAAVALLAGACSPSADADILIENVDVVDLRAGAVMEDRDVLVRDGRITAVEPHGSERVRATTVIAADGAYLIPGLWEMHAHIRSYEGRDILPMFVAYGVTGIRDLGLTRFRLIREWQDDIERGALPGPRILSSGVIVEGETPRFRSSLSVTAVDRIAPALDSLVAQGIEIVKLFESVPGPVYREAVAYARAHGLQTAGHIPTAWDQAEAAASGVGSIEHFWGIGNSLDLDAFPADSAALDRLAAALVAAGTFECPTLVNNGQTGRTLFRTDAALAHTPAYHRAWWQRIGQNRATTTADSLAAQARISRSLAIAGELARRGVKFLAGTDTPNPWLPAGLSLHAELAAFVEAGFTPAEALRTATVHPAEYFGRQEEWGLVEPGYVADLVLLQRNPLEDIANTRTVAGVIAAGRYLSRDALQELKDTQEDRLAMASPGDLDQAIYMEVRRGGVEAARRLYPDPRADSTLNVDPSHLRRFSRVLSDAGVMDEARSVLEWNLELFPGDAETRAMLDALRE